MLSGRWSPLCNIRALTHPHEFGKIFFISAANTPRLAAGTDRRWGFQRGAKSAPLVAVRANSFRVPKGAQAGEIQSGKNTPPLAAGIFI